MSSWDFMKEMLNEKIREWFFIIEGNATRKPDFARKLHARMKWIT